MPTPIQLHIPTACHENWQAMTPREQGRFCSACQKTVTDFTLMSDGEILDYLSHAGDNFCGRFTNDQMQRDILPSPKTRYGWRYAWNFLLAGILTSGNVNLQTRSSKIATVKPGKSTLSAVAISNDSDKPGIKNDFPAQPWLKTPEAIMGDTDIVVGQVAHIPEPTVREVKGIILNEVSGEPIPFATIFGADGKVNAMADSAGHFKVNVRRNELYFLKVSSIGYKSQAYGLSGSSTGEVTLYLKPDTDNLDTVSIVGYSPNRCSTVTVGMVSRTVVVKRVEKIQRQVNDILNKGNVKLHPNPVVPGQSLYADLFVKEPGEYYLELIDASGKIYQRQKIVVNGLSERVALSTQSTCSRGVYWVRLTNLRDKKVYNGKLVIQ